MRTFLMAAMLCLAAGSAFAQSRPFQATVVSIGTSAGLASSAHTRSHFEMVNQSGSPGTTAAWVYCTTDGSTPVASQSGAQIELPPLGGIAYTSGVILSNAINCIATVAATPLLIIE